MSGLREDEIARTKGDCSGQIDDLIDFLSRAKENGATHYEMYWSKDPMWAFKWFRAFRIKPEREVISNQIKALEEQIESLKNLTNGKPEAEQVNEN